MLESFEDYVSVETLDGENKYDAGDHGLQVNTVLLEYVVLYLATCSYMYGRAVG